MIFTESPLSGAYVIEPELNVDERGFFARLWCRDEFEAVGLETRLVQCSISHNRKARSWNDPAFGIVWPSAETRIMAERDATYPDFERIPRAAP
jgi:dTDP-4-dehydrorhamnose 3,5-epimerase